MRIGHGVLLALLVLWGIFVHPVVNQLIHYTSASKTISPDTIQWSIQRVHEELWRPVANFEYAIDGKIYHVKEIFQAGRYRNPYAAEEAIKAFEKEKSLVWYSSKHPGEGTLERFFPQKKMIYSMITLCLVFYAAWLASYVDRYLKGFR